MILLFAYQGYYPLGGINDLVGEFVDLDAALAGLEAIPSIVSDAHVFYDSAHAYDTDLHQIVAQWESGSATRGPYGGSSEWVIEERIERVDANGHRWWRKVT